MTDMRVMEQLTETVALHCGDCLDALKTLDENSIDACVTDPPYHLTSIVKRFGDENAAPAKSNGPTGVYARASAGFMGQKWDGGDIAFRPDVWREVFRVLKPGAHLLSFGGTRTYHRMACAIEDAGFEIRDCVQWLYGSGFPKSHDVSKGIDRAAGAEREVVGEDRYANRRPNGRAGNEVYGKDNRTEWTISAPSTSAARQWSGFGTALKPACELIVLARKPLSEGTVAANVLRWGTGALNIDGCRVAAGAGDYDHPGDLSPVNRHDGRKSWRLAQTQQPPSPLGRWPANVIHDGSDEVVGAFPESGPSKSSFMKGGWSSANSNDGWKRAAHETFGGSVRGVDDSGGSAARFFYTAKADSDDRLGSRHPTVKPLDLIQYLVRLVTPPGGLVLDPFAGTGTTGEAAWREGMRAVLIEREAEYQDDIRRRMKLAMASARERRHGSAKAKQKGKPRDDGPLFGVARESWDEMWERPFDYSKLRAPE